MTESVAAAQAEAARTASPELLSRTSAHPSGPFQDFPALAMQSSDALDGPPPFDRVTPVRPVRPRDDDENDSVGSGSTAEVRRQLQADDEDDRGVVGVVAGAAAESESVVPADDESYVQGPPSSVPESDSSRWTPPPQPRTVLLSLIPTH
jgi:hypothetical protein